MATVRRKKLVENAVAASIAAIEIYNKPLIEYREETFSILMLNAWELLLKARIIMEHGGKARSIFALEYKKNKNGEKSKRKTVKMSSANLPATISISKAINIVSGYPRNGIDKKCASNLQRLQELRNSSVHLHSINSELGYEFQLIATAAVANFVTAAQAWFGVDFSRYKIHLMPLSFHPHTNGVDVIKYSDKSKAAQQLSKAILGEEEIQQNSGESQYHAILSVHVDYRQGERKGALSVRIDDDDPDAKPITLKEDDFSKWFPMTYKELVAKLRERYSNFKVNAQFHAWRKALEGNENYCRVRYLDERTKKTKQYFYNSKIVEQFDKHYDLRSAKDTN